MKNYYEILEVNNKASVDIIKKVFKLQIKKYHPDIVSEDKREFAEKKVKELNEAYDILSDETKRKEYDKILEEQQKNSSVNNTELLNEIEELKQKLLVKEQIIDHFLGDLDLSEYENIKNTYHNKFKDDTDYYDLNQNYNNFNSQNNEKVEQNNGFNLFNWIMGKNIKDESFISYYLRIFISFILKILILFMFIIILFIIVSIFTGTNVFGILINVFFS